MTQTLFNIRDRLALVTGSSRGLGNALARGLAQQGARVILHGRDLALVQAEARAVAQETGAEVEAVSFDVTDAKAAQQALETLINQHGVPDILVNNAGLQRRAPFNEFTPSDWDALVATNLSSLFYVSQVITRAMGERGSGKVINIGSVQSKLARETIAPYSATKGGVALLTQGMAADLARFNIQVNCISPGYFKTEMNTALWQDPAFNQWVEKRTPAQRWGHFDELVGTLVYLCSDASSFVSGQNIFVDGGMTSVV
ncbi:SDR family oxidoreductase [Vreelandella populi]|uniref:SDR family oxidoreductase n=1 Tax=Vreelandella populi TaxID=2498858 RepID=A0A433LC63_9GAMM|nr:SDR family oxidoreductase [Halomonas populi]RUR39153.1 SDR family oxidoreductase [Halomonas populi]RUR46268.1 SDR family oxidoreductase [Halomonas populi]